MDILVFTTILILNQIKHNRPEKDQSADFYEKAFSLSKEVLNRCTWAMNLFTVVADALQNGFTVSGADFVSSVMTGRPAQVNW
jgi:hypothetical protein